MVAGADSMADMDLLRHGGMGRLFTGVRAPSTLGTFVRAFRFGYVRQLDAIAARVLAGLAQHAPIISTGEPVSYLDIDDTVRSTFGDAKQGAGYGYSGVKGLNALLATVSTASSAPLIVATRLRKGSANSARGAARLVADAIKTTRSCCVSELMVLRADSAYYGADVIAASRRHGVHFSITARKDRAVAAGIGSRQPAEAAYGAHLDELDRRDDLTGLHGRLDAAGNRQLDRGRLEGDVDNAEHLVARTELADEDQWTAGGIRPCTTAAA